MGRTLPWKPAGHPSTTKPPTSLHPTRTASPPQGTSLSRPKPAAPSAGPALVSGPVPPTSPAPSPARSRTDGSASPPSSPPRPPEAPIPESFMVEGFDNDDRWRMVEDEFYSVASRFTAHLHAAQYRRLKYEAKKRDSTIQALPRPVTRPPTLDVVRRQAASALAASQRRAIAAAKLHLKASDSAPAAAPAAATQSEDEDSDTFQIQPPRKRTHLASLLDSPRKKLQPLANIANSSGKARAASLSTSSQPSRGTRAGTPSARPTSFATPYKISIPIAKTAQTRERPRGIPGRPAVGRDLTPEPARSQSDRDSNVDGGDGFSPRTDGTQQPNHLTAAALGKPLQQQLTPVGRTSGTAAAQSAELNDDSDSGTETYFQRRLRARRSKSRPQRGHKPPTPDELSAKQASQARPEGQDTSSAALSVPSI